MARSSKAGPELFIGTSGYSYPDWKGIVYPRSVKRDVDGSTQSGRISLATSIHARSTPPSIGEPEIESARPALMR